MEWKKKASVLLAVVLLVAAALAGCSGGGGGNDVEDEDVIKIGSVSPTTDLLPPLVNQCWMPLAGF